MLGIFACLLILHTILSSADFFSSKMNFFFQNNFLEYHQSDKQFDPDQFRRFVGPDLGPNCLQRLSADDTGRERV